MAVSVVRCKLSDILQAIESQLVNTGVVGDPSNVYWVIDGFEPPPGTTGQRDILLLGRDISENKGTVTGGGRFGGFMEGMVHVILRHTNQSDHAYTRKDFIKEHDRLQSQIFDVLHGKTPDTTGDWVSGNMLTVAGLYMERNSAMGQLPAKAKAWGDSLGAYRFTYMPALTTTDLG